ncbi:hypothetical protein [Demequina globuliformis]|uniref:hypothetical protein n=1 Tax=Demequina globuliformis TaxID=676202 RepID=UPI000A52DAA6|nr:hypothetical protein [Demequina globuliformis]
MTSPATVTPLRPGAAAAQALATMPRYSTIRFRETRTSAANIRDAGNRWLATHGYLHLQMQVYRLHPNTGRTHKPTEWEARVVERKDHQ